MAINLLHKCNWNIRQEGRENGVQETLEVIMAKNFPKVMTQKIPNPGNSENSKQHKLKKKKIKKPYTQVYYHTQTE